MEKSKDDDGKLSTSFGHSPQKSSLKLPTPIKASTKYRGTRSSSRVQEIKEKDGRILTFNRSNSVQQFSKMEQAGKYSKKEVWAGSVAGTDLQISRAFKIYTFPCKTLPPINLFNFKILERSRKTTILNYPVKMKETFPKSYHYIIIDIVNLLLSFVNSRLSSSESILSY